jgi:multicomponent K+:H+ antiporter subunit E
VKRSDRIALNRRARHRLLPYPIQTVLLFAVWLMLNNTLAPGHIVVATLLSLALPFWWHRFWPHAAPLHRPGLMLRLFLVVVWDVVSANIHVASQILGLRGKLHPAMVDLPLELQDELAIALLASIISLAPGTVTARISQDRTHLIVHMLDVKDAERAAADIKRRYEAPLREIFE